VRVQEAEQESLQHVLDAWKARSVDVLHRLHPPPCAPGRRQQRKYRQRIKAGRGIVLVKVDLVALGDRSKARRGLRENDGRLPRSHHLRACRTRAQDRVLAPAGVRLATVAGDRTKGTVAIPCLKRHPRSASRG
jgi:hypothetical protein